MLKLKQMSYKEEITSTDAIDVEVPESSGFASFFFALGTLFLLGGFGFIIGCTDARHDDRQALAIGSISSFVVCFNLFFASHIVTILANSRWSLNKIALNTSHRESNNLSLTVVVDQLKKISKQNKVQSEALKTSIEELSEKTDKTNAYLHHIYQNSTKAPPPPSS